MIPSATRSYTVRQKIGALLIDFPRLVWALCAPAGWGGHWTRYRNREDRLHLDPNGPGVYCEWEYSRDMHLCHVFPFTGRWLLRRAMRSDPIRAKNAPDFCTDGGICSNGPIAGDPSHPPEVSFLIGHRGMERVPQLLQVLQSIAAQQGVRFECIVVEQDVAPTIRGELPQWIRYVHTPISDPDMPYARAWALNVAAAHARAPLLVFHDNDLMVPERYGAALLDVCRQCYEAINLKRFVFYFDHESGVGADLLAGRFAAGLEGVVENLEGGGSLAVTREAFEAIGGYDESFIGWGGEDLEFWDRCLTRRVWRHAVLPMIHLWHPAQPGKRAVRGLGLLTAELTERRRLIDPERRIAELVGRSRGQVRGMEKDA